MLYGMLFNSLIFSSRLGIFKLKKWVWGSFGESSHFQWGTFWKINRNFFYTVISLRDSNGSILETRNVVSSKSSISFDEFEAN